MFISRLFVFVIVFLSLLVCCVYYGRVGCVSNVFRVVVFVLFAGTVVVVRLQLFIIVLFDCKFFGSFYD